MPSKTLTQQSSHPWKLRVALAALVALAGGGAAFWTVLAFEQQIRVHVGIAEFFVVALVGAFCAGLLLGPWIGQGGVKGVLISLVSFLAATICGAFLAGILGLNFNRLDLVALWLFMQLTTPAVVLWLGLCGATHLSATVLRGHFKEIT